MFIMLFLRFFIQNPEYIPLFPFRDCRNVETMVKDKRLKAHATNVAYTLTMMVENIDEPEIFLEMVDKLAKSHKRKGVVTSHFQNLRKVLFSLLSDALGTEVMNETAINAWSKAWEVIIEATIRYSSIE